jgi:hypothetical protein
MPTAGEYREPPVRTAAIALGVDIKSNRVQYANYPLHALYPEGIEAPFPFLKYTHAEDQQLLLTAWQEAVNGNTSASEIRVSLADAIEHWYRLSLYPSLNQRGRPVQIHCLLEDINHAISERKQLERLSTTDSLTHLPNRTLWADHLNMALASSRRVPGSQVAVISRYQPFQDVQRYQDAISAICCCRRS